MHGPTCPSCANLTRAQAYRYIGEPHIIPLSHGSGWLAWDLYTTLNPLKPGDEVTIDYRGVVDGAPVIAFMMEADGSLTATYDGKDGRQHTLHNPPVLEEHYSPMVKDVLKALTSERGARGAVIVDPREL